MLLSVTIFQSEGIYYCQRTFRNFHNKEISNHLRQFFYITPNHVKGSNGKGSRQKGLQEMPYHCLIKVRKPGAWQRTVHLFDDKDTHVHYQYQYV